MYPHHLMKCFGRARERCLRLADSERILGYAESAKTYRDMAYEFETLGLWVSREMNSKEEEPVILF